MAESRLPLLTSCPFHERLDTRDRCPLISPICLQDPTSQSCTCESCVPTARRDASHPHVSRDRGSRGRCAVATPLERTRPHARTRLHTRTRGAPALGSRLGTRMQRRGSLLPARGGSVAGTSEGVARGVVPPREGGDDVARARSLQQLLRCPRRRVPQKHTLFAETHAPHQGHRPHSLAHTRRLIVACFVPSLLLWRG